MYAPLPCHLLLQQRVDEPVTRGLHLALELVTRDDQTEVRFGRGRCRHGLVVRVQMGVVVDLEVGGLQSLRDLSCAGRLAGNRTGMDNDTRTFWRIRSAIGVVVFAMLANRRSGCILRFDRPVNTLGFGGVFRTLVNGPVAADFLCLIQVLV